MLVPIVLTMVTCDAVWRDPGTGKMTLLGIFTDLVSRGLPVELDQACVYFHLSGHQGPLTVRLDLFRTADDPPEPLVTALAEMVFVDRLETLDGAFTLYNLTLPMDGEYTFLLSAGDTPLAERRVFVKAPPGTSGPEAV